MDWHNFEIDIILLSACLNTVYGFTRTVSAVVILCPELGLGLDDVAHRRAMRNFRVMLLFIGHI
jgi:hypothetical protein